MPFGYVITTGLMAVLVLFAVAPPRPRRSSPVRLSFWLGFMVNELPFVAFYVLAASTTLAIGQGDIANPVGWIGLGLAVLATAGLVRVVLRAMRTGPGDERAGRGRAARSRLRADCPWPDPLLALCRAAPRASSGSRTSPTATRGARTGSTCIGPGRTRAPARRSSTCTAERSASARRAARPGRSSTGSLAADGSASARTTGCARSTPTRSST